MKAKEKVVLAGAGYVAANMAGFSLYTAASSALAVATGPIGLGILGAAALVAFKKDSKKTIKKPHLNPKTTSVNIPTKPTKPTLDLCEDKVYKQDELEIETTEELREIAEYEFGIDLADNIPKQRIINVILLAQQSQIA